MLERVVFEMEVKHVQLRGIISDVTTFGILVNVRKTFSLASENQKL